MAPDSRLEATVDKILAKTEDELLAGLGASHEESLRALSDSQGMLEEEYDRIIDEAKKEAEKIHKQLVGSSDLETRNRQLVLVEEAIDKVFERALAKISGTRDKNYAGLIRSLVEEAAGALGTTEVTVHASSRDADVVGSSIKSLPGARLSPDPIECLGGVKVRSRDGTMTFDNTIDARFERMKPLIRKEIAKKFGIGD